MKLNWVDILIVIIMIRICYVSFKSGLSHEIFPLFGSIVISVISIGYYNKIAAFINQNIIKIGYPVLNLASFILLAVASSIVLRLLKVLLDKIIQVTWHPVIEKFGGIVAGVAKASIITSLVLMTLVMMPLSYLKWAVMDRSQFGMDFLKIAPMVYAKLSPYLPDVVIDGAVVDKGAALHFLDEGPGAKGPDAPRGAGGK